MNNLKSNIQKTSPNNPNPIADILDLQKQITLKDIQIEEKERIINEIHNSRTWKIALIIQKTFNTIYPINSYQRKIGAFFYQIVNKLIFRNHSTSFLVYQEWIKNNEPAIVGNLKKYDQEKAPTFSIITPVYKTPPEILVATVESVLGQTFPNWEMCIVNGSPEDNKIITILDDYSGRDNRVKIITLETNLGIAGNTNAGIATVQGEFIAFLDHDDLLSPFALEAIVGAINQNPKSDLFYSDEDKISADCKTRFDPFFKPALSPEYLRSINYICHFLVVRKSLGDTLGWLRSGFEGAQDFDLILRAVEKARFVTHIPKVLYHWRVIPGSTAHNIHAKDYASQSGIKAVREHLQRIGLRGDVRPGPVPTSYQVRYTLSETPQISIIIPNNNHAEDLQNCVSSIINKSSYQNFELLIIENHSTDPSIFRLYEKLKQNPSVKVLEYRQPFNYSMINNFAADVAQGDLLLFLNNDTEVINEKWLECMLEYALQIEIGTVGAKLIYQNGTIQHAGVIVGINGYAGHPHKKHPQSNLGYYGRCAFPQNYLAVTAACMMVRKQVFKEVGGFDERFALVAGDVDFCLRLNKKGYRNVWTPYAELYHYESKTRGYEDMVEKKKRFEEEKREFWKTWGEILLSGDPYYNPNLTLVREDFSINPGNTTPEKLLPRSLPGLSK